MHAGETGSPYARALAEAWRASACFLRDGEGTAGAGAPPPAAPPAPPALPAFTPPTSQADLDALIERSIARERAAFRAQIEAVQAKAGTTAEERAELERLRQERVERERKELESKGNYDRALQSVREEFDGERKKYTSERESLLAEIRQIRCNDALLAEASKAGAINAQQVALLLANHVRLNDQRKTEVLDESGQLWLKGGNNITITDLMEKFATDNPHLFKARDTAGSSAGTKGSASTSDTTTLDIDARIAAAEEAYKKAHEQAAKSQAMGDIMVSQKARRDLDALKKEKAAGKR